MSVVQAPFPEVSTHRARISDARALCDELRRPFRVNRRSAPRWRVDGHATLMGLGAELGSIVELSDLHGAPWWLDGFAPRAAEIGTRVTVGFSDPGAQPAAGRVERCEPSSGGGYRIAVRFDGSGFA